jgi:KipI family sensor histidine kinase inhibitor
VVRSDGDELQVRPAGDAAVMVDLGHRIDLALNRRLHALAARLRQDLAGAEVVPGYSSLLVSYDPETVTYDVVEEIVRHAAASTDGPAPSPKRFVIPVVYGGEHGPDLEDVARYHDMSPEEVVIRHTARAYPIFCLGFSPGFPFLGELDPALHTPRLDTPRSRISAGSVAIGGAQTGVYPTSTPGGWRIIGRTPLSLFDVRRSPPVPYAPGDLIRFERIDDAQYARLLARGEFPGTG